VSYLLPLPNMKKVRIANVDVLIPYSLCVSCESLICKTLCKFLFVFICVNSANNCCKNVHLSESTDASWLTFAQFVMMIYVQHSVIVSLCHLFICACISTCQVYDLRHVPSWSQLTSTSTLFIGAGAGPSHVVGTLAEVCIATISSFSQPVFSLQLNSLHITLFLVMLLVTISIAMA